MSLSQYSASTNMWKIFCKNPLIPILDRTSSCWAQCVIISDELKGEKKNDGRISSILVSLSRIAHLQKE